MSGLAVHAGRIIPRGVRNWLRSPTASLAWILDDLRYRVGGPREYEIRPDWRLTCHAGAYRTAYRAHLEDPEQRRELDAFIRACRPGMVLFDLGAHFGLFSLAALRYGGAGARAVAVEPSAFASRMLHLAAGENGGASSITVIQAAAGERPGRMEMIPVGVIAAGYYSASTAGHGPREREEVRVVTVDELADETGLRPTHIKIDVEGAEAGVLAGAKAVLSRRPGPWLALELHNAMVRAVGGDPGAPLDTLAALGYEIRGLDGLPLERDRLLAPDLVRVTAHQSGARP